MNSNVDCNRNRVLFSFNIHFDAVDQDRIASLATCGSFINEVYKKDKGS